jgi:hypothetical protein
MKTLRFLLSLIVTLTAFAAAADQADVSISIKNYDGPKVEIGQTAAYEVIITNNGPDTARDVKLSVNHTAGANPEVIFSSGVGRCADLQCTVGSLAPNATARFVPEQRFASTPMTVTIRASVASSTPDPNPNNNVATASTEIVQAPDLSAFVGAENTTEAEQAVTLTANVNNSGIVDAHDVVFRSVYPSGTDIRAVHPPAGWQCEISSLTVTCSTAVLAARGFANIPIDVIAPPQYAGGSLFIETEVTEREEDLRPENNKTRSFWTFYKLFVVSSTDDSGFGTLRQAIIESNGVACGFDCRMVFRIPEEKRGPRGWWTIQPLTPLPPISTQITVLGPVGTAKSGSRIRPQIMIDGSKVSGGNGLEIVASFFAEISGLAIGNFPGAGMSITGSSRRIRDNFIGTLPNGVEAAPNERGIIATGPSVTQLSLHHNVVSGNRRSGIALSNISRPQLTENSIGLGADGATPVPNGASGVYLAEGCDWAFLWLNDLAYNGDFGVAIHPSVKRALVSLNAIYRNRQLGIDYGVDVSTPNADDDNSGVRMPNHPVIRSARWDEASGRTVIEGEMISRLSPDPNGEKLRVELYTDDSEQPQARVFLGSTPVNRDGTFRLNVPRDLRGQPVTGIGIRYSTGPWFALNEQTSEISEAVRVE